MIPDPERVVIIRGLHPRVTRDDVDILVEVRTNEPPVDISFHPSDAYGRPPYCVVRCQSVAHATALATELDGLLYAGRWLRASRARRAA